MHTGATPPAVTVIVRKLNSAPRLSGEPAQPPNNSASSLMEIESPAMSLSHRRFFLAMAAFWMVFGLGTTFYPKMMQMFMTPGGVAASTAFSDSVWLHDGLDILSVCVLLFALSTVRATKNTLTLAAIVGLFPVAAIVYSLAATPFMTPLILVPGLGCFAFAIWGFLLASRMPAVAR
jgi:hypothetical protein